MRAFITGCSLVVASCALSGTAHAESASKATSEIAGIFRVGFKVPQDNIDEAISIFLKAGAAAEAALTNPEYDDSFDIHYLHKLAGDGFYYAAERKYQNRFNEDVYEYPDLREWLIAAAAQYAQAFEGGLDDLLAAEYVFTQDLLFDSALIFEDERLPVWSEQRVEAARLRILESEMLGDPDAFNAKAELAERLIDHSWLTQDESLMEEAAALAAGLPEDKISFGMKDRTRRIDDGKPPFRLPDE